MNRESLHRSLLRIHSEELGFALAFEARTDSRNHTQGMGRQPLPRRAGYPFTAICRLSILRRLLDVIDDKDFNWPFGRFEFQPELFL